jgi:hypothetical protein
MSAELFRIETSFRHRAREPVKKELWSTAREGKVFFQMEKSGQRFFMKFLFIKGLNA